MRSCFIFQCNLWKVKRQKPFTSLCHCSHFLAFFTNPFQDQVNLSVAPSAEIHRGTHTRQVTKRLRHVADLLSGRRNLLGEHSQMICKRENAIELRCGCLAQLLEERVVRKICFGLGGLMMIVSYRDGTTRRRVENLRASWLRLART